MTETETVSDETTGNEQQHEFQQPPSEEEVIQKGVDVLEALEKAAADGDGELRDTETPAAETEETPAPVEEERKSPEEVRYAERVAELARRDRLQRQERQRLAQERSSLEKQIEEAKQALQREQAQRDEFQRNPRAALQKHFGLDVIDLLQAPEDDDNAHPSNDRYSQIVQRQQEQIEALVKRLDEKEQREQQEKQQQHTSTLYENVLGRISGVVQADPDAFEAVMDRGRAGAEDVFAFLNAWYEQQVADGLTPAPPDDSDIREAAKMVEETYRKQELEELKRKAASKRFAGRLTLGDAPITEMDASPQAKAPTQASQPKPTLTNSLTGQPTQKRQLMSEEERMAAALAIPLPEFKE